jgi:hypothetical protein
VAGDDLVFQGPHNTDDNLDIMVVTGSKFTVTNTTAGAARFYELRKP